ncbi:MAG: hypothetical protein AAFV36_02690 [Myxococcota bacterium]
MQPSELDDRASFLAAMLRSDGQARTVKERHRMELFIWDGYRDDETAPQLRCWVRPLD